MRSETESTPERRARRDRRRRHGSDHVVWLSVTGVVAIVMVAFVAIYGITRLNDVVGTLKVQQREVAALRAEQSRASCLQQNATITGQRAAFAASIEAAIPAGSNDPRIAEFKARYLDAVNHNLRFRDCSTSGIRAYFENPPAEVACQPDGKGFCHTDPGGAP